MLAKYDCHLKNMASSSFLPENGNSVAVMLFLMTCCPCCTADLLDPSLFSQTLTKLASDGLGVSNLQVRSRFIVWIHVKSFQFLCISKTFCARKICVNGYVLQCITAHQQHYLAENFMSFLLLNNLTN